MPTHPYTPLCRTPGCRRPATVRGQCAAHGRQADQHRGLNSDRHHHYLYQSPRWRQLRERLLAEQPLCRCERCLAEGRTVPTTVVHHRQPHGGDLTLFFDARNLEALGKRCHDRITGRSTHGGR
jgi:5-methylcytosine-specific restriction protein A